MALSAIRLRLTNLRVAVLVCARTLFNVQVVTLLACALIGFFYIVRPLQRESGGRLRHLENSEASVR